MAFTVVTMLTILALLATAMQGRKLERDTSQRATCTAPMATKGETAVVTCHYPLDVKPLGKIVAVSVERYPFTSSSTGPADSEYILECVWDEHFNCTLDEEEPRVEGKKVVITIRNVTEDNQGRYVCQMNVKDGSIIHGDSCELLVNVTSSAAQMPVGHIATIVVGCAVAVAAVVGAVIVWKKCIKGRPKDRHLHMENGEHQHQHPGPGILGAPGPGDNDGNNRGNGQQPEPPVTKAPGDNNDDNRGNGPPAERVPLLGRGENQLPNQDPDRPGARDERNNGDDNHGNVPPAERVPLLGRGENQLPHQDPERPGAQDERNNDDDNQQQGSSDDRPEGLVPRDRKHIEGRQTSSRSTSDIRLLGFSDDRPEGLVPREMYRTEVTINISRSTSCIRV